MGLYDCTTSIPVHGTTMNERFVGNFLFPPPPRYSKFPGEDISADGELPHSLHIAREIDVLLRRIVRTPAPS